MTFLLFILGVCTAIYAVVVLLKRHQLKARLKQLTERINHIPPYTETQSVVTLLKNDSSADIIKNFERTFNNRYITIKLEERFITHYKDCYEPAKGLVKELEKRKMKVSPTVKDFINAMDSIDGWVKVHNQLFIQQLINANKSFFDHCLSYPLDGQQRRAIVSEEDNCLVVSSAGSGKTSSIVGKVKYLIEKEKVDPARILLISYTHKSAAELTERARASGLRGYTFHKLALDIIGSHTGVKPSICENTDALVKDIYHELLKDRKFCKHVVEYFVDYQDNEKNSERQARQKLSEQKAANLKALLPDMDGRAIYVKSEQEKMICFALSSLGLKFRYEEAYEHNVADEMHSQYKPDFSIYYKQDGEMKRLYLEHFGVNERGLVPEWFASEKGVSYKEANQRYNDGITWKRTVHEKFGTKLIATSSADFRNFSDISSKLKMLLVAEDVPIRELSEDELYSMVLPEESRQEKMFIRLIATFVALLKSSCKSVDEIIRKAERAKDERSVFVYRNIFRPAYERYKTTLAKMGKIDFTDAILQATDICNTAHPVQYDFIIVDEFQDISVDRYNFLKALRQGNPPAKLYCVGDDWQSIYRFSGSDMALFNKFSDYFGPTEINKIETTYRFGEPLIGLSSEFIQRNSVQVRKNVRPFNKETSTSLLFQQYNNNNYCVTIEKIMSTIPADKSVFLLGRYTFDDILLSSNYKRECVREQCWYIIGGRKIEFLTVHKAKGLEADYVILLQCNKDDYGFPSEINDDPSLQYLLSARDRYPYGEERRLFYVAITRAKTTTWVMYDERYPSVFVTEFLHPEKLDEKSYIKHPNANKPWTPAADKFLLTLYQEGKCFKYISDKMGRSQTAIVMRLGMLNDPHRKPKRKTSSSFTISYRSH